MDIKNNTVSAVNQMVNSSEVSFLGKQNAKIRILVVGNSITRHGPKKDIGWDGDWGMAASAPEKDYVHRLYAKLVESGRDVYMRIRQCAFWERNYLNEDILSYYEEERAFDAHIVVFRLGENVPLDVKPFFNQALEKFITYICPNGRVIFSTCFWENPIIDEEIKLLAYNRGEECVDCCFSKEERNMAIGKFEHKGVSIHPSDYGMELIAAKIFEKLNV